MKTTLLLSLLSFFVISSYGQSFKCGNTALSNARVTENTNARVGVTTIPDDQTILIPVVVHVVTNPSNPNSVSDANVCAAIKLLNEDFSRLNVDKVNTPADFEPLAANSRVQFYLANKDPNNNATTGITRTTLNLPYTKPYLTEDDIKTTIYGHLPWDATKYLNMWVSEYEIRTNSGLIVDGVANISNGVVLRRFAFVDNINLKVLAHEVGHWLNLIHIWGGDTFSCTDSDGVSDTPNQEFSSGSLNTYDPPPAFPKYDACTNIYPGVMFMNYMDYSSARNIFTKGQVTRMRAVFNAGGAKNGATYAVGNYINGSNTICSSGNYSISSLPSGLSIVGWVSLNPNALSINSSGFATRLNNATGTVTVYAQLNGCSEAKIFKTITLGVGTIGGTYTYGSSTFPINGSTGISVSNTSNTIYFNLTNAWDPSATYSWITNNQSGTVSKTFNGKTATITLSGGASISLTANANNTCGSTSVNFSCYNYSSSYRLSIFPNPTSDEVTIETIEILDEKEAQEYLKTEQLLVTDDIKKVDIYLLDKNNEIVVKGKFTEKKLKFDVRKVSNGTYYLHIGEDKNLIVKQVVIQH